MAVETPPRFSEVLLPILESGLPDAQIVTAMPEVSLRSYPLILVRRLGGTPIHPIWADRATINIQTWHQDSIGEAEKTALQAQQYLWKAWKDQTIINGASIGNFSVTSGINYIPDPGESAWRVQGSYSVILRRN